jgi:YggT family protein
LPIVAQQFVLTIASILDGVIWFYSLIVLGAVICSWVSADPRNGIVRFLYSATEPVLHWIRRRLPFVILGGFDLSPLILIFGLQLASGVVVQSLRRLAVEIH